MDLDEALRVIRKLGYLNLFSAMTDTWAEIHSVPGKLSRDEDRPIIPDDELDQLLDGDYLIPAQDDWQPSSCPGSGLLVRWFTAAPIGQLKYVQISEVSYFPMA